MNSSAIMRQTWSYSYYADLTCSIYVKSEAKGLLKKKRGRRFDIFESYRTFVVALC